MSFQPVKLVSADGIPVSLSPDGQGTPFTVVENNYNQGLPVTLVASGGIPVNLFDLAGGSYNEGGQALLGAELNGFAIDATVASGVGSLSCRDVTTPANTRSNISLYDSTSPLTNAGTSPKLIDIPAVDTWLPHNLVTYSNTFTNAAWTKTNTSVSTDGTLDPTGEAQAALITAGANDGRVSSGSATTTSGLTYTISAWMKRKTGTGAVTFYAQSAPTGFSSDLAPTTEWARYEFTFTSNSTLANIRVPHLSVSGDEVYVYGAQVNRGSVATDYVATTTSASGAQVGPRSLEWSPHNLTIQSQDISTTWINVDSTDSTNDTIAPDGTVTADTIIEAATTANHGVLQSPSLLAGQVFTVSSYVKVRERIIFGFYESSATGAQATFNVSTGVVVGTAGGGTPSASIEDVGDGWYRCAMTFTPTTTGSTNIIHWVGEDDDTSLPSYLGDITKGIYVWGAQVNRGPVPTTYLPTTTAAKIGVPVSYDIANSQYGILSEPAATNLQVYSQAFDNAAWAKQNATVTIDAVAPDGTTTATTLSDDGATGTSTVTVNDVLTVATATVYTLSVYAKADQLGWMYIALASWTTPSGVPYAYFNLSTGALGTIAAAFDGGAAIQDVGNGWYRCSVTFTTDAADTTGTWYIGPAQADANNIVDLDGTSSILIWQAQAETGTVATSPIPTYAATATRAADNVSIAKSKFPIGAIYSIYVQYSQPNVSDGRYVLCVSDGTVDNFIGLRPLSGAANLIQQDGGSGQANISTGSLTNDVPVEHAARIEQNNFIQAADGTLSSSDTSCNVPTTTTLYFGQANVVGTLAPKRIYKVFVVPRALTDAELIAVTS